MRLNESKRDDLLLPYLNILKQKGINASLGQLKSFMLRKLTEEGGMRNLSLGSNFYLAGAIRYYFNGDLTLNKDLSVFKDDPTAKDTWNSEVCSRLNVLINILRDAYIDTIGEKFEQPEDFGTLSIARLLRKYNKKINAVLNNEEEPEVVETEVNRNFGNGYSYEIIYSYQEARKYYGPTYPGSWCITYAENHYNHYIRNLGIHYVILRKDGWENVKREKGPNWSYRKPQDEFGCSLIALLQSNTTGEPVYITSRWNHGHGSDDSYCEADHAFTKDELMQITGITDDDLQRIFKEWKKNSGAQSLSRGEMKKEQLKVVRQLKYAQMKMNGGDFSSVKDVINVLYNFSTPDEEAKLNKHLLWCSTSVGGGALNYFLMDKGRIVFDTLTNKQCQVGYSGMGDNNNIYIDGYISRNMRSYNNLLLLQYPTFIYLYDTRRRQIIEIGGIKKFKAIPKTYNGEPNSFYEIMASTTERVLMFMSNNTPLKLPNGEYWYNNIKSSSLGTYGDTMCRSNLGPRKFYLNDGGMLEILYDESSGERFFFDVSKKRFLETPPELNGEKLTLFNEFNYKDYIAFTKSRSVNIDFGWSQNKELFLLKNGEIIDIDGYQSFKKLKLFGNGIVEYVPYTEETKNMPYYGLHGRLFNLETKAPIINPETHQVIDLREMHGYGKGRLSFIYEGNNRNTSTKCFIYDTQNYEFLKNPIKTPSEYGFYIGCDGNTVGKGVVIAKHPYPTHISNTDWKYSPHDYFLLNIPGVDNSERHEWKMDLDLLPQTTPITTDDINAMVNEVVMSIFRRLL